MQTRTGASCALPRHEEPEAAPCEALNREYGRPGAVDFHHTPRGMLSAALRHAASGHCAEVSVENAHITRWMSGAGKDLLFAGALPEHNGLRLELAASSAARPQAWTAANAWQIASSWSSPRGAELVLQLKQRSAPAGLSATLRIVVSEELMTELVVRNANADRAALLNCSFVTYLPLSEVRRAGIGGLHGLRCRDLLTAHAEDKLQEEPLRIHGPVNRCYYGQQPGSRSIQVRDSHRVLALSTAGCSDFSIWHPGAEGGLLAPEEPRRMLRIAPGNEHTALKLAAARTEGQRPAACGNTCVVRQTLSYQEFI